jgi:hypothetical protein
MVGWVETAMERIRGCQRTERMERAQSRSSNRFVRAETMASIQVCWWNRKECKGVFRIKLDRQSSHK